MGNDRLARIMKMKRCKCCGWWFEPQKPAQKYCDDECCKEGRRSSWLRAQNKKRRSAPKKSATLKVDAKKLPVPRLPATKEVRVGEVVKDYEISKYFY